MNGSKMARNVSLRDFCRARFSIFEVNSSQVCNTRNIQQRSFHRLGVCRERVVSGFYEKKLRPDVNPVKFVTTDVNKFSSVGFGRIDAYLPVPMTGNKYGAFLCQRHCVLSSTCRKQYLNSINVRRFSDGPPKDVFTLPHVQLEGIWKSLAECAPVEFSQNALVALHSATGLPWWATVVLATWSMRALVTLPLALYQHYVLAKYYNLRDELNVIVENLKLETNYAVHRFKWPEKYARAIYNRSFKKQRQKLIERHNCHPLKSIFLVMVQIPMWITLSTALRNLCYVLPYNTESARAVYFELTTGGFGWATDLTIPDNMYIIPVTLGVLNLTIIEMQNLMKSSEPTRAQKYVTNFFRLIAVGMVPLASFVPTAMSLYWVSSSAFGIIQNFVLMSPSVRHLVRIPPTDRDLERPYNQMYINVRRRIGLRNDALLGNVEEIVNTSKRANK